MVRANMVMAVAALAASLIACSPSGASSNPAASVAGPQFPAAVASLDDVEGTWQVVSFGGYEPARVTHPQPAAFANFTQSGVGLRIGCNWSGAPGTVRDGHFAAPAGDVDPQAQTAMGCGKEREDRDSRYFAFFRQSPTMELLNADRLKLQAGNTVLILQRPEAIRRETLPAMADMAGDWRAEGLMLINEEGRRGIGLSELQARIAITGSSLAMTSCPASTVAIEYTADGRLARVGGADAAQINAQCGTFHEAGFGMPDLKPARLADLLAGSPKVYYGGPDRLTLQSGDLVLDLTREPCTMLNQSDDHTRTWTSDC